MIRLFARVFFSALLLWTWSLVEEQTFAMNQQGSTRAQTFFTQLNKDTMNLVDEFYDKDATFIDPLGTHRGVAEIRKYYEHLYENVIEIRFDYENEVQSGNDTVLIWTMRVRHKKVKGGDWIVSHGNSYIRFDPKTQKAIYHRDYFDMGEFLYENIPVVGGIVRYIRKKAAQK